MELLDKLRRTENHFSFSIDDDNNNKFSAIISNQFLYDMASIQGPIQLKRRHMCLFFATTSVTNDISDLDV